MIAADVPITSVFWHTTRTGVKCRAMPLPPFFVSVTRKNWRTGSPRTSAWPASSVTNTVSP
jgi:hypothetical protein